MLTAWRPVVISIKEKMRSSSVFLLYQSLDGATQLTASIRVRKEKGFSRKKDLWGFAAFFLADSCNSPMLMKIFKTGAFDDEAVDTSQATPFREFAPPKFTKKF